jgi:hypothetical protein
MLLRTAPNASKARGGLCPHRVRSGYSIKPPECCQSAISRSRRNGRAMKLRAVWGFQWPEPCHRSPPSKCDRRSTGPAAPKTEANLGGGRRLILGEHRRRGSKFPARAAPLLVTTRRWYDYDRSRPRRIIAWMLRASMKTQVRSPICH